MIYITITLAVLVVILVYLAYIQSKKYNNLLKYTEMYIQLIGAIAIRTKGTYDEMVEIDRLGAFQADDEVGTIFNELKENITDLNEFITKYVNTGTQEESTKK